MFHLTPSYDPRHRYNAVRAQLRVSQVYAGDDPWEESLSRMLAGDADVPGELLEAFHIFNDAHSREQVEALMLAGGNSIDLLACLQLRERVSKVYHFLFFDTDVFSSLLARRAYARDYDTTILGGQAAKWKQEGLREGLEYLKVQLGGGSYAVTPVELIQKTINVAYKLVHRLDEDELGTPEAGDIRQWMLTAVKGISQMPTAVELSGQQDTHDVIFTLEQTKQAIGDTTQEPVIIDMDEVVITANPGSEDAER